MTVFLAATLFPPVLPPSDCDAIFFCSAATGAFLAALAAGLVGDLAIEIGGGEGGERESRLGRNGNLTRAPLPGVGCTLSAWASFEQPYLLQTITIQSLPVGVLQVIFSDAASSSNAPSLLATARNRFLRAMRLVCGGWSGAAQESLWREVRVVGTAERLFCEALPPGRSMRAMELCGMDEESAARALVSAGSRGLRRLDFLGGMLPVELLRSASTLEGAYSSLARSIGRTDAAAFENQTCSPSKYTPIAATAPFT